MRAAIYARVSTVDQQPSRQVDELHRYVRSRGWTGHIYVDGDAGKLAALDTLRIDAKQQGFDVVVCWRLDRLGRSLRHLITLLDELIALDIGLVSLQEGIDTTAPSGRSQLKAFAAMAEAERDRVAERVQIGLQRARAHGRKLGRPHRSVPKDRLALIQGLTVRQAAKRIGVSRSTAQRWIALSRKP